MALQVLELLNADLHSRGVTFDQARLGKIVSRLWPDVQKGWDFEVERGGPLIGPGNPKATFKRVQKFFEANINTNTIARVEYAAKEADRPAVWGEFMRLVILYGHGLPLPGTVEITMLMRVGAWRIEKAKTSRGSCRVCGRSITEGALRFGQDEKNSTWFHLACGAEGAPRAFKPFAAKAAELLATSTKDGPRATVAALPPAAKKALEAARVDTAALAVLTDWLQSTGDAWGELLMLEAAGKSKEAKAHLARHRASLTGSFGPRSFEWKKGFIDAASLEGTPSALASQVEELAGLRTAARLRELALSGKTDKTVFEAIQKLPPTVRTLSLEWPGKGLDALSLPKLNALRIRLRDLGDDLLEAANLPGLRTLEITGKRMGGGELGNRVVLSIPFLDRLLQSKLIGKLHHLVLDFGALDEAGCRHLIANKTALSKVRTIELGAGFFDAPLARAVRKAFEAQRQRTDAADFV